MQHAPLYEHLKICYVTQICCSDRNTEPPASSVVFKKLKPQAEDKQARLRAGKSTLEQIFNLRVLCKKYLQHKQNMYHVFIDFENHLTGYGMQPLATMR